MQARLQNVDPKLGTTTVVIEMTPKDISDLSAAVGLAEYWTRIGRALTTAEWLASVVVDALNKPSTGGLQPAAVVGAAEYRATGGNSDVSTINTSIVPPLANKTMAATTAVYRAGAAGGPVEGRNE